MTKLCHTWCLLHQQTPLNFELDPLWFILGLVKALCWAGTKRKLLTALFRLLPSMWWMYTLPSGRSMKASDTSLCTGIFVCMSLDL